MEFTISTLLAKKNFLTRIMGWTIHDYPFKSQLLNYESINIKSLFGLIFLFLKSKITKSKFRSYSSIEIFNTLYVFGYFQNKQYLKWRKVKSLTSKYLDFSQYQSNKLNKDLVIHIREGDFEDSYRLNKSFYKKGLLSLKKFRRYSENIYLRYLFF